MSQRYKPVKILSMTRGENSEPQPHLKHYWQLVATGEGRVYCLQGCGPWKGAHALGDGFMPVHTWAAALVRFSELFKKNKRTLVLKGLCCEDQIKRKEGMGFAMTKPTVYVVHMEEIVNEQAQLLNINH